MTTPLSSAWWVFPVLFAVMGAAVHGAAWFVLDWLVTLTRFGWPFNNLATILVFGAITGAIFGRAVQVRRLRRQVAIEDPVEPEADSDSGSDSDVSNLPNLPAFADRVSVSRRSVERIGSVTIDVFDVTLNKSDGDGGTVHVTRTVALLQVDGLPAFELRPLQFSDQVLTWAGAAGVQFDANRQANDLANNIVKRFKATYRLTTVPFEVMISGTVEESDDAIRRLFTLGTMRAVLRRTDWRVQSHSGHLVCWVAPDDALGPKRRERLVADAVDLQAALLVAQAGKSGDSIVPAPTGAVSSVRQAARFQGAMLGAVFGAFLGFFVAGMVKAAVFFGQRFEQRVLANDWSGVWFPVSIVLGAAMGATIGRLLPLQRPMLRKPSDPWREKLVGCSGVVGLFGGFLAGGIGGGVLGEMIGLGFDDTQMRMLLFFGGIGVGMFSGPIVLGVATHFVYGWWTGKKD